MESVASSSQRRSQEDAQQRLGGSTASSSVATTSRGGAPNSWAAKSEDGLLTQRQQQGSSQANVREESAGSVRSRRRRQANDGNSSAAFDEASESLFPPDMGNLPNEGQNPQGNFRDWLAAGAVDVLKMTGGVALSTTGKLVAPPIQMTRMLLPGLMAAIIDSFDKSAPERLKDWVRIFSSSIYHLVTVLKNTEQGHIFRSRLGKVGGDLRDLASSDIALQAIVDTMSTTVKFTEALQ
jgi:hypothetical protein